MSKRWVEVIGWYGVCAILLAYILNSLNVISSSNIIYSFLNLTGALGISIDAWKQKNYQPVVLNLIWAFVAALTLVKLFFIN